MDIRPNQDSMAARDSFVAACVQNCATDDSKDNAETLVKLINEAADAGANFIALPEACDFLSADSEALRKYAIPTESHVVLSILRSRALELGIWLLVGSVTTRNSVGAVVNRSVLVSPSGDIASHYDKIHMFDANLDGEKPIRESDIYEPGRTARLADLPWGTIGLSICYDIRFPSLYRALARGGASLLAVPAAFMQKTGEAHWQVLLRSRAIENGCFVIAPAQWGNPYGERQSYGHSMIVDPWGNVLAEAVGGDEIAIATIDMSRVSECRTAISSLNHDREFELAHLL